MKTRKRSIPDDRMCFDHKGKSVFIMTHGVKMITVTITEGNKTLVNEWVPVEKFIEFMEGIGK